MALLFQLTQKLAQGFQAFYDRFPRKEAKVDAQKAWNQKVKTPETEEKIHEALDWQIPMWEHREIKYVPLPATYLRGERWEDQNPNAQKLQKREENRAAGSAWIKQVMAERDKQREE